MSDVVELDGLLSNYLRRKRKEQVLPYITGVNKILDVGCGKFLWEGFIRKDQYYLGIDLEDEILKNNKKSSNIKFKQVDINNSILDNIDDDFDLIIMLASIEHFSLPQKVMSILKTKLVTNGVIILTTPAPWADIILDTGAKFGIFAKDKHQHQELLGKKDIEILAHDSGLIVSEFKRFLYFQNQLSVLKLKT